MTNNHSAWTRAAGVSMLVVGTLTLSSMIFAGRLGLADAAGNVSPLQLAVAVAGIIVILTGAILALRPTTDPRPLPRYFVQTIRSILNTFGDWIGNPRAALVWMIPILLLAAALRFYHLVFQSYWLDELMTWWRSSYPDLPTVLRSVESDVWPPGFSLWAWLLIHTFGASDFILRFFPALAGILSAAATYTLGRRLGGHLTGLWSSLLIAILEISIYYSQEARPYSGLILFSILSTYFWLRLLARLAPTENPSAIIHPPDPAPAPGISYLLSAISHQPDVIPYILTALLAMYWNYYGLILVAFQGIGMALRLILKPRRWPAIFAIYAAIAVGFLPWLPATLADLGRDSYLPVKPGGYIDELMAFFRVLFNLEHNFVLAAIALVVAALATDAIRRARGDTAIGWSAWIVLLGWLLLPFTLTYVRSLVSVSTFLHRYLLISLPAAVLLPALALARLPVRRWLQAGVMLAFAVLLLNNLVRHWDYYTRPTKAQFREAVAQAIALDSGQGGPALIVGYTGYHGTQAIFDFYFTQLGSSRHVDVEAGFGPDLSAIDAAAAETGARTIVVIAAQNPPDPSFIDAMNAAYTPIDHRALTQADVWIYEVK